MPPKYVFCTTGEVSWPDAAVGWTLLYHLIPGVDLDKKSDVQAMLGKIKPGHRADIPLFPVECEYEDVFKIFPNLTFGGLF